MQSKKYTQKDYLNWRSALGYKNNLESDFKFVQIKGIDFLGYKKGDKLIILDDYKKILV